MEKKFYEIVMEGRADFVRGFITGLLEGKCVLDDAFTGADYHIEKRGGQGFIMRFLSGRKDECIVVAGNELKDALISAASMHHGQMPFKIVDVHEIKGAKFRFSFMTYSKEVGNTLKNLLNNLPERVSWEPIQDINETVDPESQGIEAYAPVHDYDISAKGEIHGQVKGVFLVYHELKKHEVVELSEIKLENA